MSLYKRLDPEVRFSRLSRGLLLISADVVGCSERDSADVAVVATSHPGQLRLTVFGSPSSLWDFLRRLWGISDGLSLGVRV